MTERENQTSEKNQEEVAEDMRRARAVIKEDIKQLGERLRPDSLKNSAKEAWHHAKEQALDAVSDRGRRAASAVADNGPPLLLMGLGAGWLATSLRKRREEAHWYRPQPLPTLAAPGEPDEGVPQTGIIEAGRERAHRVEAKARRWVEDSEAGASRALEASKGQLQRTRTRVRDFANENPLAFGAALLAAGIGAGLLLPATRSENRWMGPSRDRLVGRARGMADEARSAAERIGETTRETSRDVRATLSERGPSS